MTTFSVSTTSVYPVPERISIISPLERYSEELPAAYPQTQPISSASPASTAQISHPAYMVGIEEEEQQDDEMLIRAIRQGVEQALEMLYQRYSRYAYVLAYRITHDSQAAEDIVQEAFLAVWNKATSYQEQQGSVRTWLQAIVHHRAIDRLRASLRHDGQWTSLLAESGQDTDSAVVEVWEEVWRNERNSLIHSMLERLPEEQRQVIELGYFAGYTHTEIAERWHIPLGTVKGRMRLGLQKMRQLLSAYDVEMM